MGRTICDGSAVARALFDEANHVLGWDLKGICFNGPEPELTQTRVCQPARFVHGLAVRAACNCSRLADRAMQSASARRTSLATSTPVASNREHAKGTIRPERTSGIKASATHAPTRRAGVRSDGTKPAASPAPYDATAQATRGMLQW